MRNSQVVALKTTFDAEVIGYCDVELRNLKHGRHRGARMEGYWTRLKCQGIYDAASRSTHRVQI